MEGPFANLCRLVWDNPSLGVARGGVGLTDAPPGGSCVNDVRASRTFYFASDSNG